MSVRLSERDLRILTKCAVSKWLTTGQLQRLYFPDVTVDAVRKSLRRLADAGYLTAYRENRMAEALHTLGPKGKPVLEAKGLEVELFRAPPRQIVHMIGINEIRVAVEADPTRVAYFFAAWELARLGWTHLVIPDAIFAVKLPERHTFLAEYDRGTEPIEQLSRKVSVYANGLSGFPFGAVMLVTDTAERMEAIHRELRLQMISLRLLGATLSGVRADGIYAVKYQNLSAPRGTLIGLRSAVE